MADEFTASMFPPQPGEPHTRRMRAVHCPWCGHTWDAVSSRDGEPMPVPTDGSFGLCIKCGQVAHFSISVLGVSVRQVTAEEDAILHADHPDMFDAWRRAQAQQFGEQGWLN
jgi:hypothetical protein